MSELTPVDLLKTRSVEPRPRSNLATIASVAIAFLALVCSTAVLCITTENQCNDRRDRMILQQPNIWLERDRNEGVIFLVNSGPGAALIRDSSQIYKGNPLPPGAAGGDYQRSRTNRLFSGEREWAFGMSALAKLQDAAFLCAGRQVEGCLRVGLEYDFPLPNFMMSPGQRIPVLRITNLAEIEKRVTRDDFLAWQNLFGSAAYFDDIDFRIEYCPLSREFGPCRTITGRAEVQARNQKKARHIRSITWFG
jgi:hypothetical protein